MFQKFLNFLRDLFSPKTVEIVAEREEVACKMQEEKVRHEEVCPKCGQVQCECQDELVEVKPQLEEAPVEHVIEEATEEVKAETKKRHRGRPRKKKAAKEFTAPEMEVVVVEAETKKSKKK